MSEIILDIFRLLWKFSKTFKRGKMLPPQNVFIHTSVELFLYVTVTKCTLRNESACRFMQPF